MIGAELVLVPTASKELGATLAPSRARARCYAAEARAQNTRRAYDTAWRAFTAWCDGHGLTALPADGATVAIYLAELADGGRKTAGIALVLTAISQAHLVAGAVSPREAREVAEVWKGIRRTLGTAQKGKAPLLAASVTTAAVALGATLTGLRDRALLLLAFAGAFRRSELVGLTVADLLFTDQGLAVTLQKSKTDQEGHGRLVPISFATDTACPVRAVQAWLEAASITAGPVFRGITRWGKVGSTPLGAAHVGNVVKAAAAAAGLDGKQFSAHSTRAGFCTSAAAAGASNRQIMRVTGHRSDATVNRYVRPTQLFDGLADVLGPRPKPGDR